MEPTAGVLKRVRAICLAWPGTREKDHFGEAAFTVKGRIFATCGGKRGNCEIVLGLRPGRTAALVKRDPRFTPYPRDRRGIVFDASGIRDWGEVEALLRESYELRRPRT